MHRICVIIPGLGYNTIDKRIIRLQPWNYLLQIALKLNNRYSDVSLIAMDTVFSQDMLDLMKRLGIHIVEDLSYCKHVFIPIAFKVFLRSLKLLGKTKKKQLLHGILTTPLMNTLYLLYNYIIIKTTGTSISIDSLLRENIVFRTRKNILNDTLSEIIVPSKDYEYILREKIGFKHKITVYYPEIKCNRAHASGTRSNNDKIIITYFGAFSEERGVISLLKAAKLLANRYEKEAMLQLLIRRTGSRNIEKYRQLLEDKNNIIKTVIGDLSPEELHKRVSSSSIIILPYRVIPSTIPLAFFESLLMYRSIPVISTLVPGIMEHIVKYTPKDLHIKPVFSIKSLASILAKIVKSEGLRREISDRQSKYAAELCQRLINQRIELLDI